MEFGTCPCCLMERSLVESHLIPRKVYDFCRGPGFDPVLMTHDLVLPTQRQIRTYLLCAQCEDLLNREGEAWSLPLLAKRMGEFPLFDLLEVSGLLSSDPKSSIYSGAKLPAIKTERLVHLGLGIFWKASVHGWRNKARQARIKPGKYTEEIRLFLRSEAPFPRGVALLLTLTPPPVNDACFTIPRELRRVGFKQFMFYLPGLKFDLIVGKNIDDAKRVCLHSSPEKLIFVEDLTNEIRTVFSTGIRNAYRTRKFRQYAEQLRTLKR